MKCPQARSLLSPYLDSELEGTAVWEVARHLEECPACREFFAREGRLEQAIQERLQALAGDEERVFARALKAATGLAARRLKVLVSLMALLVCLLGAGLLAYRLFHQPRELAEEGQAADANPLKELLAHALADHRRRLKQAGSIPWDARGPAVGAFLKRSVGFRQQLRPEARGWDLVGARLCVLGTWRVVFVQARHGAAAISLFLIPPEAAPLAISRQAARHPCFELPGGFRAALARRDGWVALAVGSVVMGDLKALAGSRP